MEAITFIGYDIIVYLIIIVVGVLFVLAIDKFIAYIERRMNKR